MNRAELYLYAWLQLLEALLVVLSFSLYNNPRQSWATRYLVFCSLRNMDEYEKKYKIKNVGEK